MQQHNPGLQVPAFNVKNNAAQGVLIGNASAVRIDGLNSTNNADAVSSYRMPRVSSYKVVPSWH
jgi:hypothetical protein